MNDWDGVRDPISRADAALGPAGGRPSRSRSPTRGSSPRRIRPTSAMRWGSGSTTEPWSSRASPASARAALGRDQRVAWMAFGLGLLSWTAGDVYWTLAFSDVKQRVPYPSAADAGYLGALPCFYVGIALLIKRRIGHFTAASWLDGAIGGLAAAALGTALLAPALVGLTKGDPAAVLTNLAYPLGDILLISFIVGALVVSGFRGAGAFLAISAGLIAWTLGDGIYLYQEATSAYQEGWLDEVWLVGGAPDRGRRGLSCSHRSERRAGLQLADGLPLDLRRDRGRGPDLGSLQPPARGLDLALGGDPGRSHRPDGNQLPREHEPDGGAPRRRGHRLADRARQPPQADRRPGVGAGVGAGRGKPRLRPLRPRRVQVLQRQLRPSGGRQPAPPAGGEPGRGGRARWPRLPPGR